MKHIELQREFESKIGSLDSIDKIELSSDDVFYWINIGLLSFIDKRINGLVQQNQMITDDLSTLVKSKRFEIGVDSEIEASGKVTTIDYKVSDYRSSIGENVTISFMYVLPEGIPDVKTINVDVVECTVENITSRLNNYLSEHILHNMHARPLRLYKDDKIYLYTDGNYNIVDYEMVYVKTPNKIQITSANAFSEYIEMPSSTHTDIVDEAISAYLASLQIKQSLYPREQKK